MNKKIFTLLAGAFLMFAMVFSVKAQVVGHGLWDKSRLSLGDSVPTLKLGMNSGYYHLRVDSIVDSDATFITSTTINTDSALVLYMGKANAAGQLTLFVDSLNHVDDFGYGSTDNYPFLTNSKAEESAAALWCVNIGSFDQGQNITFDFINKQQNEMLEVDIFGYETWLPGTKLTDKAAHVGRNLVPGGISGWEFSETFATTLESAPLISYITRDTVAVLCLETITSDTVLIKIASATDVQAGKVDGVIYFRLMNAAPFIINADDYNTMFGKQASSTSNLKFTEDVTSEYTNPFTTGNLKAEYLTVNPTDTGTRIDTVNWSPWYQKISTVPGQKYDTTYYSAAYLDSLGYMAFFNSARTQQVQVLREYFEDNAGGHQFLQIELDDPYNQSADSLFYGQYVFRMVYYPSGDSIYINPYQATYYPKWDAEIIDEFDITQAFADSASLAVFTYYADTAALQNPNAASWGTPAADDSLNMVTARLKFGKRTDKFYEPFTDYHKLYVSLQNLTGGQKRRLTLNSSAFNNHTINTHINFGIYNPCKMDETGNDRTTVAPDVYLIRNTAGQYLHVPLYSATDSAVWVTLEKDVDPRYLPSFHWVVEKRYITSDISPVTITNREFEWLDFDNIQLYKAVSAIELRGEPAYPWTRKTIHAAVTTWEDKANNDFAFVRVAKEFKNDELLGYTWLDPDTSIVNQYAFNYMSGIDNTKFIGWNGDLREYPHTDTTLYVNYDTYFDKMFFSLDTIQEAGYGGLSPYGFNPKTTTQIADLAQLKRQAYRLTYKDPYKFTCIHEFCMAPGEDAIYSITKRGTYKSELGKPVFYLRNVYKPADDVPYFAMVQRIDSLTVNPGNTLAQEALERYLDRVYGEQLTDIVMDRLDVPATFNQGLFVAAFDDATSKIKMTLRADAQLGGVATFKLQKDEDPIYRRFNTVKEGEANDNPDLVHFFSINNPDLLLFENTGFMQNQQSFWRDGKKNYLGHVLRTEFPNLESHSSTTIYVDTAYINRGTGYIKPQYLLAVRPQVVEPAMGCNDAGEPVIPLPGYMEAYYLINAYDSAHTAAGLNQDYLWESGWTRLVFTRAIHANDYLYILGEEDLSDADIYGRLQNGNRHIDLNKLHAYAIRPGSKIHAIYLGDDNKHKDCVFSFRLVERRADDFIIESETTGRDYDNGPIIAPCEGGWIKDQNGVPVITRSDEVNSMVDGMIYNVYKAAAGEKPTANDDIETSNVTVIGDAGAVSILNASGKKVVISNILGQTVAQTVLTSDNETIAVAKGIVIVSIEGENAVKTLVK